MRSSTFLSGTTPLAKRASPISTAFNVACTLLFIPFHNVLITLAEKTIKTKPAEESQVVEDLSRLDQRFYSSPAVALDQCNKIILSMGKCGMQNLNMVDAALVDGQPPHSETFRENESFLDRAEARLNSYMLGIKRRSVGKQPKDLCGDAPFHR